ncbi:hypothetical protein [Maribellus sp. YY47]|uniref:hypothetical protein n=1 Tax=Maribellus sp. YY47 TaxID=2929486 RepID=UPI0020011A3D|nr:hypothetical protein [Maribellus sp. YY47]MCK3685088.1 hypothetical protein [Maribellus sp. YY47]
MFQSFKFLHGKSKKPETDFRQLIPGYSDDEIIRILKRRTYYIPEASRLAIDEAIKRGIIHSEQDLFSDEYKVEELSFSWFPHIRDLFTRAKIRKSIARSLVIAGVIPLVFGMMQMNRGLREEGSLVLAFGLVWMFFSAQLNRNYHKVFVLILLVCDIAGTAFLFFRLLRPPAKPFLDFFITGAVFVLITYGLIYLMLMRLHE